MTADAEVEGCQMNGRTMLSLTVSILLTCSMLSTLGLITDRLFLLIAYPV